VIAKAFESDHSFEFQRGSYYEQHLHKARTGFLTYYKEVNQKKMRQSPYSGLFVSQGVFVWQSPQLGVVTSYLSLTAGITFSRIY